MMDVKLKAHYWIYDKGKDVWNKWVNSQTEISDMDSREEGGLTLNEKNKILDDIESSCPPDTKVPNRSDEIDFIDACWEDVANFEDFIFKSQVNFEGAVFKQSCNFMGADFQHRALFAKTEFYKQSSFVNSKVNMLISFYQCDFKTDVPSVNGIETKGIINFDSAEFPKLPDEPISDETMSKEDRKKLAVDRDIYFKKISNFKNAYCYLKSSMNERDIHDMEIIFFRKELEARAKLEKTTDATKFLIWLYKVTSDYGDGVAKPFKFLLITSFIFLLIYILFPTVGTWINSFQITLANSIPFVTPNKLLNIGGIDLSSMSSTESFLFNAARGGTYYFVANFYFFNRFGFSKQAQAKIVVWRL